MSRFGETVGQPQSPHGRTHHPVCDIKSRRRRKGVVKGRDHETPIIHNFTEERSQRWNAIGGRSGQLIGYLDGIFECYCSSCQGTTEPGGVSVSMQRSGHRSCGVHPSTSMNAAIPIISAIATSAPSMSSFSDIPKDTRRE